MSEVKFSKIEDGELLKWETVGAKVVGVLQTYRAQKTAMGEGHVYEVKTKEGIVPFFAPTLLHKKLQAVSIGDIVQIEYTKKTKTGAGTDLKHFDVGNAPATEANLKGLGIEMFKPVEDAPSGDAPIDDADLPFEGEGKPE